MRVVARLLIAIGVATAVLAASVAGALLSADALRTSVTTAALPPVEMRPLAQRSQILAADGTPLSALYEEDRIPVPIDQIAPVMVDAVVAVEDSAFFEHDGLSVRGLLRAVRANIEKGGVAQGGSTITQQVVKNSILTDDRTVERKAKEAVLAVRMEQQYSKQEILERYLNTVYFGQGAYGVQAAAQRFFAKTAQDLTLPEAALLAGMISSPETYDPIRSPERATARRSHALRRMQELGFASAGDVAAATETPLPTTVNRVAPQPNDYFAEEVRRQLLADPRLGATPQDRFNTVFRGGITVETTLDSRLQAAAEAAVRSTLPPSEFTAALVAIDPADGSVRALVGGPNFEQAKYNLATQGMRQTGSSFKTIALAAWIADGHSPEDVVDATAPCQFPLPPGSDEPVWNVDNYDGGSGEHLVTTLREATVRSSNCAYARLALTLGPDKLVAMAKRLGIPRDLPAYPSIVLGTGEVTPLEMASVYATLAAEGVRRTPTFIRRVVGPGGEVLVDNRPVEERVLDANVARTVTDVLRGVVDRGTGRRAQIGRPVAGKTGTAQEWRDAWFAGYTPQLAAAVWMGHPLGQHSMAGVGGINVTGGSFPAQIWGTFMSAALAPVPVAGFTPPNPAAWPPPGTIGLPPPPPPPPATVAPPAPAPAPPSEPRGKKKRDDD